MADPSPNHKAKVFISYSRDDINFADQLVAALEGTGFAPLIDRHSIPGGEDWKEQLRHMIVEADSIVFVLSPRSAASTPSRQAEQRKPVPATRRETTRVRGTPPTRRDSRAARHRQTLK